MLDVCAGTNVMGISLLEKENSLQVTAIDRSKEMQQVGQERALKKNFKIESIVQDVSDTPLPFQDNTFDIITL